MLRRTADDDDPVERVIVANADQLVVVTALADPEPRPRLIDRALVAAYDAGHGAAAVPDQGRPRRPRDAAVDLPLPGRAVGGDPARRRPGRGCATALRGRTSVLVGHSGVGKSTLVNALVPDADRDVGIVNAVTGRGPAHLDVGATCSRCPTATGWIIDTPGIRSFGLAHVQPEDLIEAFPDLDEMTEDCPRGCTHGTDEPECGLDEAVAAGEADPDRVAVVPPAARRPRPSGDY